MYIYFTFILISNIRLLHLLLFCVYPKEKDQLVSFSAWVNYALALHLVFIDFGTKQILLNFNKQL